MVFLGSPLPRPAGLSPPGRAVLKEPLTLLKGAAFCLHLQYLCKLSNIAALTLKISQYIWRCERFFIILAPRFGFPGHSLYLSIREHIKAHRKMAKTTKKEKTVDIRRIFAPISIDVAIDKYILSQKEQGRTIRKGEAVLELATKALKAEGFLK